MKKIIIASPNSASESLKKTINEFSDHKCFQITNINYKKKILKEKNFFRKLISLINYNLIKYSPNYLYSTTLSKVAPAKDFDMMSYYHNDICSFNRRISFIFDDLNKVDSIAKQHFPPTLENKIYFKNWRKVILIRSPEEVLNKYLSRDNDILIHNNEYRLKLLDQIKNWNNGWKNETNSIIINKSDLVNNTFVTLKKIEEFLEIKFSIKNDFILPKIL